MASGAIEQWNTATSQTVPEDYNHYAYSAEHRIHENLTVRVKQPYGPEDVPFLIDRVIPGLDHEVDGLVGT